MKKKLLLVLLLCFSLSIFMVGCGNGGQSTPPPDENSDDATDPVETAVSYVVLDENFGKEEFGIGFRQGEQALANEVQRILIEMKADGTAAPIGMKWFDADVLLVPDSDYEFPEVAADDSSLQDVLDRGYIILGLDDSFPPMGFRDTATDEIVGFDIDLANEVATRMGVELRIQPVIWDSVIMELTNKNIDLIWNGMTITEERQQKILCSFPYMADSQIIVTMSNSGISTKADLADKTVGIQAGSSAMEAVKKDEATYESIGSFAEFDSNDLAMLDLKNGGCAAVVIDEVTGRYFIAKDTVE